jgi:hypothetical protein
MPKDKRPVLRRSITPSIPLKLDLHDAEGDFAAELQLRLDNSAMVRFEEKSGVNTLAQGPLEIWAGMDARRLSALLWAAVLAHNPEYDSDEGLEVIRSYVTDENAKQVYEALWEAHLASLSPERRKLMSEIRAKGKETLEEDEDSPRDPSEIRAKGKETLEDEDPPRDPFSGQSAYPAPELASSPSNSNGGTSGPLPDTTSDLATANSGG